MAYLLLDKDTNHLRRISDNPFDYDFDNIFTTWKQAEIPEKTANQIKNDNPGLTIKLINEDSETLGWKWFNSNENKWYKIKTRKHHSKRWDEETQTLKNIIEDYPENFAEVI